MYLQTYIHYAHDNLIISYMQTNFDNYRPTLTDFLRPAFFGVDVVFFS